ncbi:hypothetical protein BSKO_04147 [Bryopsis sp. KO-2023]|nr:hypothetical protein BSKO_04147 [Bryopsis sp. KO-2023]
MAREKEGGADIEGRKDKKPLVQSKVPFKGISVTRLDYPAHTAGVPAKAKAQETKPFSKRPFDDATTYNREFVEKDVAPTNLKSNAHPQRRQFDPKFEGQSTSHTDYPGWDVKPQQPFHPPDRKIPCLQHTQNTLYREDYPEWEIIRPSPREKKGIVPGMPLTNETTYGVDFVPKKISPSGGCRGRPWEDCESCSTE